MQDEESVVTLVDEDGNEQQYTIVELIEVDDNRYAVLVPIDESGEDEDEVYEEDAFIFRIETDENGEEVLADIEDDEEYERVLEALDALDEEDEDMEDFEFEEDEEEEEDEEDEY